MTQFLVNVKLQDTDIIMVQLNSKICYLLKRLVAPLTVSVQGEQEKVLKKIIAMLDDLYERKYDPIPCNRTDDGGMYNDGELNLISEIKNRIKQQGEQE
jgi:hypothetical protein